MCLPHRPVCVCRFLWFRQIYQSRMRNRNADDNKTIILSVRRKCIQIQMIKMLRDATHGIKVTSFFSELWRKKTLTLRKRILALLIDISWVETFSNTQSNATLFHRNQSNRFWVQRWIYNILRWLFRCIIQSRIHDDTCI